MNKPSLNEGDEIFVILGKRGKSRIEKALFFKEGGSGDIWVVYPKDWNNRQSMCFCRGSMQWSQSEQEANELLKYFLEKAKADLVEQIQEIDTQIKVIAETRIIGSERMHTINKNNIYKIPRQNWHIALASAIKDCPDGSTIMCHTSEMIELGHSAKERMCPNKNITFSLFDTNS
jgi:hypothetical protein